MDFWGEEGKGGGKRGREGEKAPTHNSLGVCACVFGYR